MKLPARIDDITSKALVRIATVGPHNDNLRLGPYAVCAHCLGNIRRGAESFGGYAIINTGGLVDEPCYYCDITNGEDITLDQIHWVARWLTRDAMETTIREHNTDEHGGASRADFLFTPEASNHHHQRYAVWCRTCSLALKEN